MSVIPPDSFFKFIDSKLAEKDLNDFKLSKLAKLSHGFMPNLRKRDKKIGYDACGKIADALGVSRAEMYVRAGLDKSSPGLQMVIESWERFTDEEIQSFTRTAEFAKQRTGAVKTNRCVEQSDKKRAR